ncbi:uncharacterized protein L969DRAFT_82133 [Mixia osmundae IAM 14324]|uniref:60S ribosomal protein L6 n=1 Tax=Mixia osmundae (strain CBS 9802 / IAM 14324 / JCM 22182 / KY 12970) TaxID=764103 RepID=G7DZP5_MIXOS|nr:uncharacterized protein L969DRAFT_82133 [Mixia osmundae IAM 14324]KEI39285.1 hypothetical protein L969DRAFT_82133 [Mixia osmundae IAM 14324]GAA96055.1 hypothetical protein E5Q_02716 [Mixia osmundae IAM 14324]
MSAKAAPTTKTVPIGGAKNGKERVIPVQRAAKFYSAEDVKRPKPTRKVQRPTKLRASITPGTILILLAGRFRGKRVVFLKQLESGLLLVTGPYKINGVPIRRVNQAYVIATSTKIDVSSVKIDEKFSDAFFKKSSSSSTKGKEGEFFKGEGDASEKKTLPASFAEDQKTLDKAIVEEIAKTANLSKYLAATFSLSNGQLPHLLKF